jgi:hypothetical protein
VGIETLLGIFADGGLKLPSNSSERYLIMNVAASGSFNFRTSVTADERFFRRYPPDRSAWPAAAWWAALPCSIGTRYRTAA